MDLKPYFIKLKLKLRELGKRFKPPLKPLTLSKFYSRHWHGQLPAIGYFADRAKPRFFFGPKDLHKYQKALKVSLPESCREIGRRATNAVAHRFNFLGSGETFLGDEINWHRDFKSGRQWDKKRFTQLRIVDPNDSSDVKIPWELSRLQFLSDLGRGYWLSENPIFKKEFKAILEDWEESNPIDIGVNWTCSMEVAIRAINIIWGLHFFRFVTSEEDFLRRIIKLLYYHAYHIENNLENISKGADSNHLISDYLGLFYIGILFPEFDGSERWRTMAQAGLEQAIREQVRPDGADYEGSTSYHRLVLEMFLSAFILARINDHGFSEVYKSRLYNMIQFSEAITPHSGIAPLIGDNDDGFVVKLSNDNPGDHRPLIDLGLLMFGERVPSRIPIMEERLWYLGPEALVPHHLHKTPSSRLFKESGYAVIRSDDFHLLFNAAGITKGNLGGHKHNDLLSFTLEIDGVPYLVDPGTFCYSADFQLRNLSRSTSLHNTVKIDNIEQNRFFEDRLFYMVRDAKPQINLWTNLEKSVIVSASHDGYFRTDDRITHKRSLSVSLETSSILLTDEFEGKRSAPHLLTMQFITPLQEVEKIDEVTVTIGKRRFNKLIIRGANEGLKGLRVDPIDYYPRYGIKAPANLVTYTYQSYLPFKIKTVMTHGGMVVAADNQLRFAESALNYRFGKKKA